MKATFEQLLNGEVNDVSIIGAALSNEQMDFAVDFEVKAESALDIARRRWRYAELISGDQNNER